LYYKKLDSESRKKIWEKNFNRLENEASVKVSLVAKIWAISDPYVESVEWNGREIRNGKTPFRDVAPLY
jgi:hypothetical protein